MFEDIATSSASSFKHLAPKINEEVDTTLSLLPSYAINRHLGARRYDYGQTEHTTSINLDAGEIKEPQTFDFFPLHAENNLAGM